MPRVDCGRGPWLPSLGSKCLDALTTYPGKRVLVACPSPMPTETEISGHFEMLRGDRRWARSMRLQTTWRFLLRRFILAIRPL